MIKNSERPHVVDDKYKKVYLVVDSWVAAVGAAQWVKQNYPGFECQYVTQQTLTEKLNDRSKHHQD